jgi:hypothetical protein
MAAYKMAAVKVTPPNDFSRGLIRSHMVVIHLFLMLCDLQRVVRDLLLASIREYFQNGAPVLADSSRYSTQNVLGNVRNDKLKVLFILLCVHCCNKLCF